MWTRWSSKDCGGLRSYLLDEQLHEDVAHALGVLLRSRGDRFAHVYDLDAGVTDDLDMPRLCQAHGIDCVVSANVRDFGARKTVYIELMREGRHVVVLRFGKAKPTLEVQMQLLSASLPRIDVLLRSAAEPTLVKVSAAGDCVPRSIDELLSEITGDEMPPRLP